MNVLIITKISKNYGAVLQAYALKTAIGKLGHTARVLNYELPYAARTYRLLPPLHGLSGIKRLWYALPRIRKTKTSIDRFLKFRERYLSLTRVYKGYEALEQDPPAADLYITGSDQVWNPKISFDRAYYLLFAGEGSRKAAYAASIGLSEIPEPFAEEFFRRVRNIDRISVREKRAREILESAGIASEVTLDPTLLLSREDYDRLTESFVPPEVPYVLLYLLIPPERTDLLVKEVRKRFPGRRILYIPGNSYNPRTGDTDRADAGPEEFIGLIRHAEAVVTSSFHGMIFSVIYRKPFVTYLPYGTGGRIRGLLEELGLEDRIVSGNDGLGKLLEPVDGTRAFSVLEERRGASLRFLKEILGTDIRHE